MFDSPLRQPEPCASVPIYNLQQVLQRLDLIIDECGHPPANCMEAIDHRARASVWAETCRSFLRSYVPIKPVRTVGADPFADPF